jgi:hypothetical protein
MTNMAKHECPRCGLESRSSRGSWADRHAATTAVCGLVAGYIIVNVIVAYPWFGVPLLVVAAAVWVDRRNRKRAAVAARADYEHRAQLPRELQRAPADLPAVIRQPLRRRPRGADHSSITEPIPSGPERIAHPIVRGSRAPLWE